MFINICLNSQTFKNTLKNHILCKTLKIRSLSIIYKRQQKIQNRERTAAKCSQSIPRKNDVDKKLLSLNYQSMGSVRVKCHTKRAAEEEDKSWSNDPNNICRIQDLGSTKTRIMLPVTCKLDFSSQETCTKLERSSLQV